ncbi:dethiobiotin synthase [Bythopirellula polymerisocia]|uniref:ATP-dependent dethiobiotin synthetase BioD n=1 Tax=Bythopirellula polymerisocia TaxID=2528003 RepID=A0A5C6CY31_9BACT|nr:dethiobiotin synthase [Bythopirellula polymerisocia]TWU29522.1 ATP-dependent dethiobiotin synthetase BioD 1 [Bythopirellula polymerisocia]
MTRGIFITGTNTSVGKTQVSALIARSLVADGHRVGVYKPVASGCKREGTELVAEDAVKLWEAAGRPGTLNDVCPQRFAAPLAPSMAAEAEGQAVDRGLLRSGLQVWLEQSDIVLVEGAGGLMSPLSDQDYNADLAEEFGFPLLVVALNELGTINATLQTLITAQTVVPKLPIAGIVLNRIALSPEDESIAWNAQEITRRASAPLLATVNYGQHKMNPPVDWFALAGG